MLSRQLERMRRARTLDEVVIATTRNATDDPVADLARGEDIPCVRGSEHDVLGRYLLAAREAAADVVVRITADCPLIEPEVIDLVVETLVSGFSELDYASNVVRRTYPQGLDVEAMTSDTLERLGRVARSPEAREHVTRYILVERPDLFLTGSVEDVEANDDLRWTVDTAADLELVRRIFSDLRMGEGHASYRQILRHIRAESIR